MCPKKLRRITPGTMGVLVTMRVCCTQTSKCRGAACCPPASGTDSNCVITLNPFQTVFYQQSSVEIHSPDGDHLETIGHDIQKENLHNNDIQLRDQICLVKTIFGRVDEAFIYNDLLDCYYLLKLLYVISTSESPTYENSDASPV
jgi:hypothetical protein